MIVKTKKTIYDYMNEPDLINEPAPLRETYAARRMIHDETKGMTFKERADYYRRESDNVSYKL